MEKLIFHKQTTNSITSTTQNLKISYLLTIKNHVIVQITKRERKDFMKKFVLFIIAIIAISSINLHEVNASTGNFYEAEYAGSIYTRRSLYGETRYQRSRFFRQQLTDTPAYCMEPFVDFGNGQNYIPTNIMENLSDTQLQKMGLYAYYGYLYPGHEDIKWYSITQQLIWQVAEPSGIYEFTNGLNGETIRPYDNEIGQLNTLVNNHLMKPTFDGAVIHLVENERFTLTDHNHVLHYYQSSSPNVTIENNTLIIQNLKEGTHTIELTRRSSTYATPAIFYHKNREQKIMTIGNPQDITAKITINVKKTELEITKVDQETNSTKPSGEASLEGAIYGLYDIDHNLIEKLTIGKDNKANIKNLLYGIYFLKEISPGIGYQLNETTYQIDLNTSNTIIKLRLTNEVIKKKIEITKEFGTINNTVAEPNITFDIYDKKGQYITSITTDENGYAAIELPYGNYIIKQKNTTENYHPVEDFEIEITEEDQELNYQLYDYKVEVPNTEKNNIKITYIEILLIIGGIYAQKKCIL